MSSHAHPDGDTGPRSLAEALRFRDDASLAALLRARPDLLSPVPNDLTQLATRASTRASVVRALGRLDRFALQTAEALAVAPEPSSYEILRGLLTGDTSTPADAASDAPRPGAEAAPGTGHATGPTPQSGSAPAGPGAIAATPGPHGTATTPGPHGTATTPGPHGTATTPGPHGTATTPGPHGTATTPGPQATAVIAGAFPRALDTLREQALVWGTDDALRLVRTARELLAPSPQHPSPTGLGPTVSEATAGMSPGRIQEIVATAGLATTHDSVSAVASLTELFTDRPRMAALLDGAPPAALEVLSRLVWGPPYGQVSAEPAAHLRWLLDRGLLLPTAPGTVTLPREAALHLRGGRAHRDADPLPPEVAPAAGHRPRSQRDVDTTAAGQAHMALGTVEQLLKDWGETGPAVLRAGGLSARDLKRTAAVLDVPEPQAAFWGELAYAAGLLASDGGFPEGAGGAGADGRGGTERTRSGARRDSERYAPTPAYDAWLDLPDAERWATLASAWLAATRTAGLIGGRDSKDRTLSALGPGLDRSPAPEVRRRVLTLLAGLPAGVSPDPATLLSRLHWERPLRGAAPGGVQPAVPGRARQPVRPGRPGGGAPADAGAAAAFHPADQDDLHSRIAQWTLTEAELLGITGRGALSSHGRALLGAAGGPDTATGAAPAPVTGTGQDTATTGRDPDAATTRTNPDATTMGTDPGADAGTSAGTAAYVPQPAEPAPAPATPAEQAVRAALAARLLAPLLPEPLDHVLLQADLTAVAPGPVLRPLADMLDVLADIESKGGATVYRFTPGSVRRALDAGQSAGDLHAFLAKHSRTPVPQPLSYLIDDVARRHGRLRVGAASAYVRCDDDSVLGEILADKRSAALRLRRLAPTVLATQADPATLLDGLRAMGFAPAAESPEGDVLITRAHAYRTPPRTSPEPVPDGPPVPDEGLLGAAVRAIRAGDAASMAPRKPVSERDAEAGGPGGAASAGELPRTSSADTLATVQAAVLTGETLWMGYVNAEGAASQRVIAPIRVEGGFVTAFDHTAAEVRTYPLHRITGVAELTEG
jgi:hypothetical protein